MAKTKKTRCIENTTAHVIVLKAMKQKPLRLFPGFNNIDPAVDIEAFFKGSKAAQGNISEGWLKHVDAETLTDDQSELAKAAKDKNDTMNRAYKILEENKRTIAARESEILEQNQAMENMKSTMNDMKDTDDSQAEQIETLLKKLDDVASNTMTQDEEKNPDEE